MAVPSALVDRHAQRLKKSGFIVPQEVPKHSWLRRGVGPPPNRYNIKPGRHWDGVDRSNGFERDMFKRQNELKRKAQEAYMWSQEDMCTRICEAAGWLAGRRVLCTGALFAWRLCVLVRATSKQV